MIRTKNSKLFSYPTAWKTIFAMMLTLLLISCNDDDEQTPELPKPTVDDIEIGSGNNEIAVIGNDFHLNANVVAGDKIDYVQIKILQNTAETYSEEWSHEITWDEYKGTKSATIHKHFHIPEDAVEGIYDFIIIVSDENGTMTEAKRTLTIYAAANLPVDPTVAIFNIFRDDSFYYKDGEFVAPDENFSKNEAFLSQVTLSGIKGDGQMYLLLINKDADHYPETIDQIDFSKVIVYDFFEHGNVEAVESFSNVVFDPETFTTVRDAPVLNIGAESDNNLPEPNKIGGANAWESGKYYYMVIYKNTTHNINLHHSIEVDIEVN